MSYVVVGAGPAGVVAAETLRRLDSKSDIVLIGDEPEPPYSRMAIPYVLTGKVAESGTYLRKTDNHYEDLGIEIVEDRVVGVSPEDGTLELAGGGTRAFDKLLIATGATPIKPPVAGLDLAGVHHCWTLEDARRIAELAEEGSEVVLMGAGFIGCIILEALVLRGVKLTVVEMGPHMVPRMMNETGGVLLKRWCEQKGVVVHTSTRATAVGAAEGADAADAAALSVSLDNGETVPARLVVVAAGVKANTDFLDGSGIEIDGGIVVDDHLETSADNVYAAGDCAKAPDFAGGWSVHAIQPTAVDQAQLAAINMAGGDVASKGSLAMNVLDTLGLVLTSFGQWQGVEGGEHAEVVDRANFRYTRLEFEGDRLVGALTLGRTEHVGVLRGLIQTKTGLGPWKEKLMKNPARIMDAYVATTHV